MIRKIIFLLVVFFVLLSGCISGSGPDKGTIQFTSSPPGAQVYLDGQFRGSTPSTLTGIEPGNHAIEFRYPGYVSWSTSMVVSSGANNVFAALSPTPATISPIPIVVVTTSPAIAPVSVTIKSNKDSMVTGDSIVFTGTASGVNNVLLTLYGPGSYAKGVVLPQVLVDSDGLWAYTWNPGPGILPGTYTMEVTDSYRTVSQKKEFTVTGGGYVSIVTNSYSASPGNTLQFSGLCTTGAQNVQLVLYGPGQYSGGVQLGTFSVQANKNWNFAYTLDNSMATGYYTMYVYDVPKTTSSTVQFSVGYA